MIRTDAGLRATRESLSNLEEAMLDLSRSRANYHPSTFMILAAPIRDEIKARRAEIDDYIGMNLVRAESPVTQSEARPTPENSHLGSPVEIGRA